MREIELSVEIEAPAQQVWAALVDWSSQGQWMPATAVQVVGDGPGHEVGAQIVAYTGVRPLRIADRMTVTQWDPPRRCAVHKSGRMLKGSAWFEVRELSPSRSALIWCEALIPPFGAPGRLLAPGLSVGTRLVIGLALRRFSRWVTRRGAAGVAG
ncbi:MAG: SRPBCC family protein [Sporichthyaceae bacterium]